MERRDGQTHSRKRSKAAHYIFAVGAVLAATLLRHLLEPGIGPYTPFLPFLLVVIISARFWELGPSLAATFLSTLSVWYFFTRPVLSLRIDDPRDVGGLLEFFLISLIIIFLSHRLRAELVAAKARERLLHRQMQLIDLSQDAIIALDTKRVIVSWNRGAAELYGWSAAEATGKPIEALLRSRSPAPMDQIRQVLAREGRWNGELTHTRRDGRDIVVESRHVMVRDENGVPTGFLEINRDISERKDAENALRISETRFRTMFENAPVGIAIGDWQGRLERCNMAFRKLLGYAENEIQGRWFGDLIPTEHRDASLAEFERLRAGHVPFYELDGRYTRKDGEMIWVHKVVSAIPDEAGRSRHLVMVSDITQRKRAEESLRESEERFRAFLTATSDVVYRMSPDWSEMRQLSGQNFLADTTAPNRTWFREYIPAEEQPRVRAVIEEAIRAQSVFELEHRVLRVDGSVGWTFSRAIPVLGIDGEIVEWFGAASDVTRRKEAEEALRERERTLERFVDAAPVPIAMFDNQMRYLAASQRYRKDFCGGDQDPVGRSHYELFPEIPGQWREVHRRCLAGAMERCDAEPWTRSDGREQWLRWEMQPWRQVDGIIGGIVLFTEDITEQKRADETLRQALEQREVANEAAQLGTWDYRFDTGQVFWDERCQKMFGMPAARQDRYDAIIARIHEGSRAAVDRAVQEALAGAKDGAYHQEYRVIWPDDSEHWVASHGRVYFEGEGSRRRAVRFVGVNMDITERKRAEEEILRLNATLERRVEERTAQLRESNRELEAFSYSVSHDLRAPLRGIDGWSLALLEDHGDQLDADARRQLDRVRAETQKMGRLIDDMLQLSRITRREMRLDHVNLSALARSVAVRLLEQNPGRRIEIEVQPGMAAQGDPQLLEIALANLLSNAMKFTAPREVARIEVGSSRTEAGAAFFVRDNGAGFDMNYAGKLFGPFQRLHKASEFPGTGIGLATVERVIRRHGGRVWADAQVNRGATFYFSLEETHAEQNYSAGRG